MGTSRSSAACRSIIVTTLRVLHSLFVAVTPLAVEAGAKKRHQRNDVTGEFLFESLLCSNFENIYPCVNSSADLTDQANAKPQKPVLMYDGKLFHTPVEQLSQQGTQAGLATVEPGADSSITSSHPASRKRAD